MTCRVRSSEIFDSVIKLCIVIKYVVLSIMSSLPVDRRGNMYKYEHYTNFTYRSR